MNDLVIIEELKKLGKVEFYRKHKIFKHRVTEIYIEEMDKLNLEKIIEKALNLVHLKSLIIDGRHNLAQIPHNITELVKLKELKIYNTLITEEPNLSKLSELKKLFLPHNKIEKLSNNLIYLEYLEEVDLYDNQLKKIPSVLNELKSVKYLRLSANKIQRIENIFKLSDLRELDLRDNKILKVPKGLLKLKNLQGLYLDRNYISRKYKNICFMNGDPKLLVKLLDLQNVIDIERVFYPVGQGAFYAEKHNKFTVVYDCGSKAPTRVKNMIETKEVFKKNEVIDILFISHFDYDHVSGIVYLKKWTNIKKVIMPLLHPNEIDLLSKVYSVLEFDDISQLIQNAEDFFGKSTKVIRVESSEETEKPLERVSSQNINTLDTSIKSGTTFYIKSNYWNFIPFNYRGKNRLSKLEKELIKEGVDIEKLKTNTLDLVEKNRVKIQKAYTKLEGDINENSLVLYSGLPIDSKNILTKESYLFNFNNQIRWYGSTANRTNRISCIYTGDTNLNKVRIENIFYHWWKIVGTIQIPHHGDARSFCKDMLRDKDYFCPLSVGTNTYGHPSKQVIEDIIAEESYPITVNEDLSSGFVEYIDNKEYIDNFRENRNINSIRR